MSHLLRLLGYQESEVEIVQSESCVVQLVDISEKADMFGGLVCKRVV